LAVAKRLLQHLLSVFDQSVSIRNNFLPLSLLSSSIFLPLLLFASANVGISSMTNKAQVSRNPSKLGHLCMWFSSPRSTSYFTHLCPLLSCGHMFNFAQRNCCQGPCKLLSLRLLLFALDLMMYWIVWSCNNNQACSNIKTRNVLGKEELRWKLICLRGCNVLWVCSPQSKMVCGGVLRNRVHCAHS
jgi:hypothetical protein